MRVLLVEDEAEFAKALRGALSRDRFVVDWVDSKSLASEASRSECMTLSYSIARFPTATVST